MGVLVRTGETPKTNEREMTTKARKREMSFLLPNFIEKKSKHTGVIACIIGIPKSYYNNARDVILVHNSASLTFIAAKY